MTLRDRDLGRSRVADPRQAEIMGPRQVRDHGADGGWERPEIPPAACARDRQGAGPAPEGATARGASAPAGQPTWRARSRSCRLHQAQTAARSEGVGFEPGPGLTQRGCISVATAADGAWASDPFVILFLQNHAA